MAQSIISFFFAVLLVFGASGVSAHAQTNEEVKQNTQERKTNVTEQREKAMQRKEEVQQRTKERKETVQQKKGAAMERKEAVQGRAEKARATVEERKAQALEHKEAVQKRIEERRVNVQAKRNELTQRKEEAQKRWEERKAKLSEKHKEIIARHVDQMTKRTQAAIDRLDKLADKIGNRIATLAAAGVDISTQKANLDHARAAIVDAQAALDSATAALAAAPQTDNPGEAYGQARVIFEDVKVAIKEAHRLLVDTTASLKGLSATAPSPSPATPPSESQ